jgi:hypothetical protein
MKSLNVIKNNFRANEILNKSFSSKLKGGTDSNNDSNSNVIVVDPTPTTESLIGEPWDKRTPRPGTKK